MKKIIYRISVFAIMVVSLTACEKELDQLPFDEQGTDGSFNTPADFENAIRGVYNQMTKDYYYGSSDGGSLLSVPDVASDNTTLSTKGRTTKETYHNWRYNAGTANLSGFYQRAYILIYSANLVLSYADGFEGENKANIVAEAKALRAMAHFDLVKTWGKIPTQSSDANSSLGIAYVTEADPSITPAREDVGTVYNKIVQDLLDARADITDAATPGRFGKDAVNLLLSRVYLYMGQWQNSIDAANMVTTPVAPRSSVVGVWEDTTDDGLIFYIPNLGSPIGVTWSQGDVSNIKPEYVVSYDFYTKFQDDDIRKDAYIVEAMSGRDEVNAIKKLLGRLQDTPDGRQVVADGEVDYKILRAAEAHLNKAEAYYNLGNEGAARSALDEVRSKRYTTPPSGETGTALRDAIRLERRLEFAFEYQRFYDLKRWGMAIQREGFGDLADGSGTASDVQLLPAQNYKFQFPVDQGILDRNPSIVQNPGYSD